MLTHPVVQTAAGPVRGTDDGRIATWLGVRYAAPPVGELRWRAPLPPRPWTEVADATAFSLCMDNKMPMLVFNLLTEGNIARAVRGERIGTLVQS